MSSTAADLLEILISEIEDGNVAYVNNLLTAAKAKITAGDGEMAPLQDGNLAGKQFSRVIRLDAAQVARICRQAIQETGGSGVATTGLDFSELNQLG
jgi:hypothetical protein